MEIELVSRETIKPSSPTPSHLKIYPLSFLDNILHRKYVPLLYFYNTNKHSDQNFQISQLRNSLSQVLSIYYPFAGRLKDKITIECNDQGVSFLVTKIQNKLSEILQNPTEKLLNLLFPDELQWKYMGWSEALISIQINCFSCGGIAISICMTHKVGDAATFFNLVNDWSIINKKLQEEEKDLLILPFLPILGEGALIFPQRNFPIFPELKLLLANIVCKRFVFQASMIKSLKEMVISKDSTCSPTRVDVVTAWIFKRAVSTMRLNFKDLPLAWVVDLRRRMNPPLSERCVGNMVWFASMVPDKNEMELHELVWKIKQGLNEFCDVYPKKFKGEENDSLSFIHRTLEGLNDLHFEGSNVFTFSSWCKFPIYEADFGWGKPTWVTTFGCSAKNIIFMMDTKDGNGIEAYVNLKESDMERFEHDVELLRYASLNPSNVIGHDA